MLEKEVNLRCRKADVALIDNLLPECLKELEETWGQRTEVSFLSLMDVIFFCSNFLIFY